MENLTAKEQKMKVRNYVLASVSLIVLVVAGPAVAKPKLPDAAQKCEARGYIWSDSKGCADKTCSHDGKTYQPGDTRVGPPILGTKRAMYMCDGFTGKWDNLRATIRPTGGTSPSQPNPGLEATP